MKKFCNLATAILATGIFSLTSGCQETTAPDAVTPTTPAATAAAEHGHEHAEGEGEHAHGHGAGPHDGTLADWGGGKYHVEFTVDHDKQEATVYVLGSDEKSPSPIRRGRINKSVNLHHHCCCCCHHHRWHYCHCHHSPVFVSHLHRSMLYHRFEYDHRHTSVVKLTCSLLPIQQMNLHRHQLPTGLMMTY